MQETVTVPEDDENWSPPGYKPPVDNDEPVTSAHSHGDSEPVATESGESH